LQKEIELLLNAIFSPDKEIATAITCRFPARIEFLSTQLEPLGITFPTDSCSELIEYQNLAPANEISLVFASENITHPMSMMGHVFIKLTGVRDDFSTVNHAASFFTRLPSINIPKIILDSFILGLPSYFALTPYSNQITLYLEQEKRSVWEYLLDLSPSEKKLIHLHIWELRYIKSSYYFVGYNCATVVYFILATARPELLKQLNWWVTPIDVARRAKESALFKSRIFIPSLDWQIRTYSKKLGKVKSSKVVETLESLDKAAIENLMQKEDGKLQGLFSATLISKEKHQPRLFGSKSDQIDALLTNILKEKPPTIITAENLMDPLLGPSSTTFTIAGGSIDDKEYLKLSILPTSHSLTDNNLNSYTESSLKIGNISLLYKPENQEVMLEDLTLYGIESLIPYNKYTGGLSSRLEFGVELQRDESLQSFSAGHLTLGIGGTVSISEDIRAYTLLNTSGNYGNSNLYLSGFPEFGLIIYEIFDMKSNLNYRIYCGQDNTSSCYQEASITQSFFTNKSLSPYVRFDRVWNNSENDYRIELGLKKHL